jgi:hypothetical protein
MSPITFEDQPETVGQSAPGCHYRQRFNLLDLLGFSDCVPRTDCRVEKAVPPEEENYRRLLIDLDLLGKR